MSALYARICVGKVHRESVAFLRFAEGFGKLNSGIPEEEREKAAVLVFAGVTGVGLAVKEKQGFRIRRGHPAAIVSALAFAASIPLQILGYAGQLRDPLVAVTVVGLPVLSAVLMIAVDLKIERKALWFSIIAVFIGVLGFAFKLGIDPRGDSLLHHASAIALYVAIVALWALTVLYIIRTKWVLVILFLIPFLKHILVNDLPVLTGAAAPVGAATWLKELSMLCFMLAMSFCAASFEKTEQQE